MVMDVWADRTATLSSLPGVEQVFPFENRGTEIGVTLHHPHGQIYAYPFLPPRVVRQIETARSHVEATGHLLCCEIVANESADVRVVTATDHWVAFVPFAARWPFEVHFYPRRHVADLTELTSVERDEFAVLYPDVLRRFDALFDSPMPYVSAWHQAPVNAGRELRAPAPGAVLDPPHRDPAQVPGRQRVGHGRLRQRRPARDRGHHDPQRCVLGERGTRTRRCGPHVLSLSLRPTRPLPRSAHDTTRAASPRRVG